MTELEVPQDRDLPAGRLAQLKEDLMAHIEQNPETEPRDAAPVVTRRRWRRIGLTAAALAAGFGLTASLVLGGRDSVSANTAVRSGDAIIITIREGKHPEDLERRLAELGVPAVVDFLDSGFGCDPDRSTGWVQEPPGEPLFTWAPTSSGDHPRLVLYPDRLSEGEIAVFEFQIDEYQDRIAANVNLRRSTGPVAPCVPVRDASIVDAERGIAGG